MCLQVSKPKQSEPNTLENAAAAHDYHRRVSFTGNASCTHGATSVLLDAMVLYIQVTGAGFVSFTCSCGWCKWLST